MAKRVTTIGFKKLVPEAQAPYQKYITDAGYDLTAVSIVETPDYIEYGTGIAVEIPTGMVGLVFPRSSVTGKDLMLKNCVGIIDSQYRGEIRCRFAKVVNEIFEDGTFLERPKGFFGFFKKLVVKCFINIIFPERHLYLYEVGNRVCQIIFLTLPELKIIEKEELSVIDRGEGGFGSTNK
jgi:dUTP pyrophosphatase